MLSFEEKKAIFQSFKLKEKKISNGRVSFVYPESTQRGQVLATQLHPSGNGYVVGKYMSEETIKEHGYEVDQRGLISIKVFSKDEIAKVITEAMKSMSVKPDEAAGIVEEQVHVQKEKSDHSADMVGTAGKPEVSIDNERIASNEDLVVETKIRGNENHPKEETYPSSAYEIYPGSCLFAWLGLTLSTVEYGFLVWQKAVRKYAGIEINHTNKA